MSFSKKDVTNMKGDKMKLKPMTLDGNCRDRCKLMTSKICR